MLDNMKAAILVYVAFMSTILKAEKLFFTMDDMENLVNESKFWNQFFSEKKIKWFCLSQNRNEIPKVKGII